MKFDDLDQKMRVFETGCDFCVLPGLYMVARLDGRGFTRLTKEVHQFEAPFDARFRDLMVETAEYLMCGCGFNMVYGYTESDEISLLFAPEENSFGRKLRKLISILAAEGSAKFSLLLGAIASFDCRISQLPSVDLAVDYFRWATRTRTETHSTHTVTGFCESRLRLSSKPRRHSRACALPTRTNCCSAMGSTSTSFPCGRGAGWALLGVVRPPGRESPNRGESDRSETPNSPKPGAADEGPVLGLPPRGDR